MSDDDRAVQPSLLNCRVDDLRNVAGCVRKVRGRVPVARQVKDEGAAVGVDLFHGVEHRPPGAAVEAQPVQKNEGCPCVVAAIQVAGEAGEEDPGKNVAADDVVMLCPFQEVVSLMRRELRVHNS